MDSGRVPIIALILSLRGPLRLTAGALEHQRTERGEGDNARHVAAPG